MRIEKIAIKQEARQIIREEIRHKINGIFEHITVSVDITDKAGQHITNVK